MEAAWAGGAVPIVVVAPERDGEVSATLAGSPAILGEPAPSEAGPVGQIVRGITVAAQHVTDTDAALIWPARLAWVDPETVTSLIERHGVSAEVVLQPTFAGDPGWPVLFPLSRLEALAALPADRMPDQLMVELKAAGVPFDSVDVGDPGVVHDRDTAIEALPPYHGPPGPAGGPPPEWGVSDAADFDETPLEGPALSPYGQAADPEQAPG